MRSKKITAVIVIAIVAITTLNVNITPCGDKSTNIC